MEAVILVYLSCQPVLLTLSNNHSLCIPITGSELQLLSSKVVQVDKLAFLLLRSGFWERFDIQISQATFSNNSPVSNKSFYSLTLFFLQTMTFIELNRFRTSIPTFILSFILISPLMNE